LVSTMYQGLLHRSAIITFQPGSRGVIRGTVRRTGGTRFEELPKKLPRHRFSEPDHFCWLQADPEGLPLPLLCKGTVRLAPAALRTVTGGPAERERAEEDAQPARGPGAGGRRRRRTRLEGWATGRANY
jgi:hypothetical protein